MLIMYMCRIMRNAFSIRVSLLRHRATCSDPMVTSCHPKSAARSSNCMEWPRFGSRRRRGGTRDDLPHHAVARHSLLRWCWNSFMYGSDSSNNYGGHYYPLFLSFLKFIIHYLSSSIFHHPNYGELPANRGWHGKYLTCWVCLQIRIGLKTDAVIITTYPSAAEFFSIPQCLKTCIDYWANFIYTSNNQFLSININPLSQFLFSQVKAWLGTLRAIHALFEQLLGPSTLCACTECSDHVWTAWLLHRQTSTC